MKILTVFLSVFFLLVSCERDFDISIDVNPQLCFNCILNPDSLIRGSLSLSQSITDGKPFVKVNQATIELKENGKVVGILQNSGDGIYRLNRKPVSGNEYEITVVADGYPTLHASTRVPEKPSVSYQLLDSTLKNPGTYSAYYIYRISKSIHDREGVNRYWHYNLFTTPTGIVRMGVYYNVNSPLIDDFNRVTDATDEFGFHYEYYLRINDTGMDGQDLTFELTGYRQATSYFMDADEHYDKYIKSTIKQKMNDGDNLLFSEPVQIYSNIENGLGIFGSAAISYFKL